MFDGEEDTCWNSDQGSPQWISFTFDEPIIINELQIKFQGGFVGQDCYVELDKEVESGHKNVPFYPEDINSLQKFDISNSYPVSHLKIVFGKSTDFFGRVTIYTLDLLGNKS